MKLHDLSGYAVDIGGTKTAVARIVRGTVTDRLTQATDGAADLAAHLDVIGAMIATLGWRRGAGDALGVTVTGRVSSQGLWSALNTGTLTQIAGAPLGAALQARFGAAGWSNDAAATALAEYLFGAGADRGRDAGNFAYITVSTGVGGGFVLQGRLLDSGSGLAGHLGFTTSRHAAESCGCGRMGTVESVASGRALAGAASALGRAGLDAREIFARARAGEDWAETLIDRSARAIAELCANIAAMVDPGCVAIGGSIGLADGYLDRVRAHLAGEPELFRRPLMAAALGPDGPLLGALAYGMRQGK